ncbi:hypothetical protein [Enterobacter hormaechei]|uniref:hypothetical protein n=1 Tax=Enterobacter hormaechei TaxID=158836 RepID=UPI0028742829|nr:hypothetical protein [Enterobacter hormaechei]MDR9909429.1 hypothetical protein [Enterobacter hormaechei subsp. steigerwaltii]
MIEPVVVSFYTPEWEYRSRALALAKQCEEMGLRHDFRPMESTGNWLRNTALKASFIHNLLQQHEHIIWSDCDGVFLARPTLVLDHAAAEPVMAVPHQALPRNWQVSCLSFRRTPESLALAARWADYARKNDVTDELAFHIVTTEMPGLVAPLPTSYCGLPKHGVYPEGTVYAVGLSKSPDKMALKAKKGQK